MERELLTQIRSQVIVARRRIVLQQFLAVLPWCLFATLLIAAAALAAPKLFILNIEPTQWLYAWLGGAVGVGLLAAVVVTWFTARPAIEAAIELDRRAGLKERVSSSLALSEDELTSDIGRALLTDAARRVERVDVAEQFPVRLNWKSVLPFVPALAVMGLMFLDDAKTAQAKTTAGNNPDEVKKQIKISTEKLQAKIREQEKRMEEEGLKEADKLLKELNKEIDKLASKAPTDRKEAMLKLNDLAKDIEKRRNELGGADKMRKELDKLKDIEKGPADKLADALKAGDFSKAQKEMEKLKDKLKAGALNKEEKEQLAKQMEKMQEKMQQMAQDHQQAREDLKQKIKEKMEQGDLAEAAKMQQELNKMEQQAAQMEQQMQQMADKLAAAQKAMQAGDDKKAAEQLDKLASQMKDIAQQLDEFEDLDQLMDSLADAKEAMKCDKCGGAGCKECQGKGMSDKSSLGKSMNRGKGRGRGDGLGEGKGQGDRPEEETDKKFYDTRVAGDPKRGQTVRVGDASGPNIAGKTSASVRQEMSKAVGQEADALNEVSLPRDQRQHAKQYFERLRKGEVGEVVPSAEEK
jgi:hypothetical protein